MIRSKPSTVEHDKIVIEHVTSANILLKFIKIAPMPEIIKLVMVMRIGNPLRHGKELSHMQVAMSLGLMEHEVIEMERIGVEICSEYMKRVSSQEAIDKFNKDDQNWEK